ncbi:kinase-like protein [Amniculicola lignicola CBS 123094]|uniref:Kinase-like protein n=1 Tax=Amniculicola lignicola CBS 123094 TaxID=1392246 RepID=A0A6A5W247_9PLEO|nr:kinase-like protein [Amniculicola lignicola CBS 123094]
MLGIAGRSAPRQEAFAERHPGPHEEHPEMIRINEGEDLFLEDTSKLPYKLLKNLGHGHSANVEMVEDRWTRSVYARKLFRICRSRDERRRIYENEIKIIRKLAPHHHVIRVFATYVTNREIGIILSPVAEGGDLETFLQDYKDLDIPRPLEQTKILQQAFGCLASGLSFMHQQKVRHKDIKPRNILIHEGSVIYTDFGYSLDHSLQSHSTTVGKPLTFTRKYCAPEVQDWGPRNSKSDIFSLGCVFLEILEALEADFLLQQSDFPYHETLSEIRQSLKALSFVSWKWLLLVIQNMLLVIPENRCTAQGAKAAIAAGDINYFCHRCMVSDVPRLFTERKPPEISSSAPSGPLTNHGLHNNNESASKGIVTLSAALHNKLMQKHTGYRLNGGANIDRAMYVPFVEDWAHHILGIIGGDIVFDMSGHFIINYCCPFEDCISLKKNVFQSRDGRNRHVKSVHRFEVVNVGRPARFVVPDQILALGPPLSYPLYQVLPDTEGKYHCPMEFDSNCHHTWTRDRDSYHRMIDEHIGPTYFCNVYGCPGRFRSEEELKSHTHEKEALLHIHKVWILSHRD